MGEKIVRQFVRSCHSSAMYYICPLNIAAVSVIPYPQILDQLFISYLNSMYYVHLHLWLFPDMHGLFTIRWVSLETASSAL